MSSVFCAYCERQGHVISDCPVLKARMESKPVVAYTSAESSFKQDFMPSGFSYRPQMGNELYQSPPSKDFSCSSLTGRDYVPLSGDSMPVHQDLMPVNQDLSLVYQDSMPVHQDFTPVYQDSTPVLQDLTPVCQDFMPVCQDSAPVYQDFTPVYQNLMPVCQDFVPASQDLPIVKDVCATSDSVSEVYKPFISEGLVSLLHDKVINRKIKILRDTGASQSLLLTDVMPFSEKSYSG